MYIAPRKFPMLHVHYAAAMYLYFRQQGAASALRPKFRESLNTPPVAYARHAVHTCCVTTVSLAAESFLARVWVWMGHQLRRKKTNRLWNSQKIRAEPRHSNPARFSWAAIVQHLGCATFKGRTNFGAMVATYSIIVFCCCYCCVPHGLL